MHRLGGIVECIAAGIIHWISQASKIIFEVFLNFHSAVPPISNPKATCQLAGLTGVLQVGRLFSKGSLASDEIGVKISK